MANTPRRRPLSNARYADFFAGFGFGCATGDVTTFDENSPVCGGFGFPRILMTSLRSLLSVQGTAQERLSHLAYPARPICWIPHSASRMLAPARGESM